MSTRCNVAIHNQNGTKKAMLYHHCDGDPESMQPKLHRMISEATRLLGGMSYDPEKVASVLIALSVDEGGIPQFMPCLERHGDVEFLYHVYLGPDAPLVEVVY